MNVVDAEYHVTAAGYNGRRRSSLSFWRITLSGGDISLIDFEKFRWYCLLSRSVGFAFCYHREYFCIWTVLVGCFVTFSGLEWSTYKPREDRTMERRRIQVSTYDIQPKHGLCADIICGDS